MHAAYSVLLCNQNYNDYQCCISKWIHAGIKVFWFGIEEECSQLRALFPDFCEARLLQTYHYYGKTSEVIVDGKADSALIRQLGNEVPLFNAAQFLVEHGRTDRHIIVEASAGTGKTTVMIDRILYLMHTVPDLNLSEIVMITFTNDATNQMSRRLQQSLYRRYQLTGSDKYLDWMEQQSTMTISTIDSFALHLLRVFGINGGFRNDVSIGSLTYERREIIKDEINAFIKSNTRVQNQVGLSFYQALVTADFFWEKIAQQGYTEKDILKMDWGTVGDQKADNYQRVLKEIFSNIQKKYLSVKQQTNTIPLNDLLRDLNYVLELTSKHTADLHIRYLFVDEFQDSDNAQIKIMSWLSEHQNTYLFVVGDIKQSIYRFRGATDTAFHTLRNMLSERGLGSPDEFSLQNNYRTAENVLLTMSRAFQDWGNRDLLVYNTPSIPMIKRTGIFNIELVSDMSEALESMIQTALNDLNNRLQVENKKIKESDKVVALTRTNRELNDLERFCDQCQIPIVVRRSGSFYISRAVRDFYAMIASYLFEDEPEYAFEFLLTPYAGTAFKQIDVEEMEQFYGDKEKLNRYLEERMTGSSREIYSHEFRIRPALSVIREMIEKEKILNNLIAGSCARKLSKGWQSKGTRNLETALAAEAIQYEAN